MALKLSLKGADWWLICVNLSVGKHLYNLPTDLWSVWMGNPTHEFWPDQSCTCIMSTWWCWSWHVVVTGVAWGWGLGFQMKRQKPTAWFLLGLLYLSTAWNLEFEDVFYIYNKGTKKHNLYNRHQFCTSVHLRLFIAGKYPPWNYSNSKFAPENGWSWNTI